MEFDISNFVFLEIYQKYRTGLSKPGRAPQDVDILIALAQGLLTFEAFVLILAVLVLVVAHMLG